MAIEIKSPTFPESIADGTVANWVKKEGESVGQDEVIAEIETDKVVLEVVAPSNGFVSKILKNEGDIVNSAEIIGEFSESDSDSKSDIVEEKKDEVIDKAPLTAKAPSKSSTNKNGPAANKLISENNLDVESIKASGKDNRVTKADVVNHLIKDQGASSSESSTKPLSNRPEKRVSMTRLRSTIAKRLVNVQQETAMLTTFNEVDMMPIKELRSKYGQEFEKQHGVKLGFMGFFVIAAVQALKKSPIVNASIDGNDVVYHGYQDIGVAVSTERGLVVPVLKETDEMSFADIEKNIGDLGQKAREGKITIEDLQGGTFTITNGGIYGSMLSTPILNPPQSAVLGMHNIIQRPVVVDGNVEIRPVMYLALSYDHRIIDGKEAVSFLKIVKESLEQPQRLFLNI